MTGEPVEKLIINENKIYQYYFEPYYDSDNKVMDILVYVDFNHQIQKNYELYKEESEDLKALFDSSYDVLYVSDTQGNTLRVSSSCKHYWGMEANELIGKNVCFLENEGVFKPSVTRMVLESGEKVSTIQTTKNNKQQNRNSTKRIKNRR